MVSGAFHLKSNFHRVAAFGRVAQACTLLAVIFAILAAFSYADQLAYPQERSARAITLLLFTALLMSGLGACLAGSFWAYSGYTYSAGEISLNIPCRHPLVLFIDAVVDVRETQCGAYLTSILGTRMWVPKDMPEFNEVLAQACAAIDRNGETFAKWQHEAGFGA